MDGIAIIILAAGLSTRMRGTDKLMEPVDGVPLLRRQALMALDVARFGVWIALPPRPHPRYDSLSGLDLHRVEISEPRKGLSHSLGQAITQLPAGTRAAMTLLADMPELQADDLRQVLNAVDLGGPDTVWRGATQGGDPGHPVVFSAVHFPKLCTLCGEEGARGLTRGAKLVPLAGQRARRDLDTPEDWLRWRAQEGA
jgi:CTP:molybdopterin cytidylyltransferase MocA